MDAGVDEDDEELYEYLAYMATYGGDRGQRQNSGHDFGGGGGGAFAAAGGEGYFAAAGGRSGGT